MLTFNDQGLIFVHFEYIPLNPWKSYNSWSRNCPLENQCLFVFFSNRRALSVTAKNNVPLMTHHTFSTVPVEETSKEMNWCFYVAESTSGWDKANPAFWLASRAGKLGASCPPGIFRVGPARKSCLIGDRIKYFIDLACSFKWLKIGPGPCLRFCFVWSSFYSHILWSEFYSILFLLWIRNTFVFEVFPFQWRPP